MQRNYIKLILTIVVLSFSHLLFSQSMIADNMKNAQEAFAALDQNNNYTDNLACADMNMMPVGIHKTINNMDVTLAVSGSQMFQNYMTFDAFLRIIIPEQNNRKLFFGAKEIKMSLDGSIFGDAKLTLLENIDIPFANGNVILRLKGGFNSNTGTQAELTYAKIDCHGLKELGLAAEVELSPQLCRAVDDSGNIIPNKKVTSSFSLQMANWNDILAEVSFPRFSLVGLDNFAFTLKNAVFDFSDLRNSANVSYPSGYQQKYLSALPKQELWRGVYAETIAVMLPPQFSTSENKRIEFSAQNMVIDDNGVTGLFGASNLLTLNDGNANGWAFSVDYFGLQLEANNLIGGKFNGQIGLPIAENTALKYEGQIAANNTYIMQVSNLDSIQFDMLNAKCTIDKNSYIKFTVKDKKFLPEAMLHGSMGVYVSKNFVDNKLNEKDASDNITELKGLVFHSLHLKTEAPHFQVEYLGYQGAVNLFNFPISISNIGISAQGERASLGMNVLLTLSDGKFTGSTYFEIVGKMVTENNRHKWKYDKFNIDEIAVKAEVEGAFALDGRLNILRDHPVYGDGFKGELKMNFAGKSPIGDVEIKARGMFGHTKGENSFRYWFVDGIAELSGTGVPIGAGIFLNGFGGGVTFKMKPEGFKSGGEQTLSATSMSYVPNSGSGLGVKAAVAFYAGTKDAVHGEACFELSFNKNGGLDYAGFYGYAEFTKKIEALGNIADKMNAKYSKIIEKENEFLENNPALEEKLKKYKQYEPQKATEPYINKNDFSTVGIRAAVGIQFNFAAESFDATADIYVMSKFIHGVASDNRAGYMVLHADPTDWYIHIGTPSNRIGLRIDIGSLASVEATAYLMVGTNIPDAPGVPPQVANMLGESPDNLNYMKDLNAIGAGSGFAFGTSLAISTGDITFLILYANFATGLGFDIMLKDYGEMQCAGRDGAIGMDGWYATGQAYGYLHGELGVKVNLWFVKGKFPIIKTDFAMLLQAKLPNPSSFKGYIAAKAELLGGLVKVKCNFKMTVGDECELVLPGGSPLDMPIISDVSPVDGDNNISVFTAPQASFNIAIGKEIIVNDENGEKTFRAKFKEFTIKNNNQNVIGELQWNSAKDAVSFYSHEVLPPEQQLKANVVITFEERKNGNWQTVYRSGKLAQETKEFAFTTSTAPDNIPTENILYSYPVISQKYYLKGESSKGYVQLKTGQTYLFPENLKNQIIIETENRDKQTANVLYNSNKRQVEFTIPHINNNSAYSLSIVSLNQDNATAAKQNAVTTIDSGNAEDGGITVENKQANAELRTDIGKVLLAYDFATSTYSTLQQKISNIQKTNATATIISSDILMFGYETSNMEPFDLAELTGTQYSNSKPLIIASATLDDYLYTEKIFPLIYQNYPVNGNIRLSRNELPIGVPPIYALPVRTEYLSHIEQGETTGFVQQKFPYCYNLPQVYKQDWVDLQSKVINSSMFLQNQNYSVYNHFATGTFPFLSAGTYKIKLEYTLPNGDKGTSETFDYYNFVR
jgi:ElaB/YqjD/DUF883 family membrane-anchored ribosome-binding protein